MSRLRDIHHWGAILLVLALLWGIHFEAEATTYQIRSQSSARATQWMRSDGTLAAPRVWSQSLTLAAYDLQDRGDGSLNGRVSLRYLTDFSLAQRFRADPLYASRFNDLTLDIALVQWRATESLEVILGRQWVTSALGINDMDGLALHFRYDSGTLRPFFAISVGRDVAQGLTPFDSSSWDVQGIPVNERALESAPWHLVSSIRGGAQIGTSNRIEIAAEQFQRPERNSSWIYTRRVGAFGTFAPRDDLVLTTSGSVHSQIGTVDRFQAQGFYHRNESYLSIGVDHRKPIFDAGSIFNLFGAQPYQSGYLTLGRSLQGRGARIELRGWGRVYFEEASPVFSLGDAQAIGGALFARQILDIAMPVELTWQVSAQTFTDNSAGEQYLGDFRLRVPAPLEGLYITGRLLGLVATPESHRKETGYGGSALLGAEIDVGGVGQLYLSVEGRGGSYTRANTALFAHFQLEAWR